MQKRKRANRLEDSQKSFRDRAAPIVGKAHGVSPRSLRRVNATHERSPQHSSDTCLCRARSAALGELCSPMKPGGEAQVECEHRRRQPTSPALSGGFDPNRGQARTRAVSVIHNGQWISNLLRSRLEHRPREEVIKTLRRCDHLECSHAHICASGGTRTRRRKPAPASARPSLVIHYNLMTCSRHDRMVLYGAPGSWRRFGSTNRAVRSRAGGPYRTTRTLTSIPRSVRALRIYGLDAAAKATDLAQFNAANGELRDAHSSN
jgi:hypothetical protein